MVECSDVVAEGARAVQKKHARGLTVTLGGCFLVSPDRSVLYVSTEFALASGGRMSRLRAAGTEYNGGRPLRLVKDLPGGAARGKWLLDSYLLAGCRYSFA